MASNRAAQSKRRLGYYGNVSSKPAGERAKDTLARKSERVAKRKRSDEDLTELSGLHKGIVSAKALLLGIDKQVQKCEDPRFALVGLAVILDGLHELVLKQGT